MTVEKRITQPQMSEKIYRSLKHKINSSAVKKFLQDREGFVREVIMGEHVDRKDTASTIIGSLVHTLLLEREKFDEKYTIASMVPPVGQMKDLCDNLYARTIKYMDENGQVTLQMSELLELAIQDTKYGFDGSEKAFKGKSVEKIVEMFTGDAELYYKELRSNYGKIVVSMFQIEKAELIANEMKSNGWLDRWVNAVTSDDIEVYSECPIVFKYKELEMRALIDRFIVDHNKHTIEPIDIKSTWDGDGVSYTYIKNLWYIQAAVYDLALKHFRKEMGFDDYTIEPMRFLIADTTGFMRSHSYTLEIADVEKAYRGFTLQNGRYCTGLTEALEEIIYCMSTGIWNTSREAIANKGEIKLEIAYKH